MTQCSLQVKGSLKKIYRLGRWCQSPSEIFPLLNGSSCWSIWTPILKTVTLFSLVILCPVVLAKQAELFLRSWPRSVSLQWTLTGVMHLVCSVSATEWTLRWPSLKKPVLKMLPSIINSYSLRSSGRPVRAADVGRSWGRWPWALSFHQLGVTKYMDSCSSVFSVPLFCPKSNDIVDNYPFNSCTWEEGIDKLHYLWVWTWRRDVAGTFCVAQELKYASWHHNVWKTKFFFSQSILNLVR